MSGALKVVTGERDSAIRERDEAIKERDAAKEALDGAVTQQAYDELNGQYLAACEALRIAQNKVTSLNSQLGQAQATINSQKTTIDNQAKEIARLQGLVASLEAQLANNNSNNPSNYGTVTNTSAAGGNQAVTPEVVADKNDEIEVDPNGTYEGSGYDVEERDDPEAEGPSAR